MGLAAVTAPAKRLVRQERRRADLVAERIWELQLRWGGLPSRGEMTALLRRNGLGTFSEYVEAQVAGAGRRNFLPVDRARFVQDVRSNWPDAVPGILGVAEAAVAGRLSLFGREGVPLARRRAPGGVARLDWPRDPLSGKRFPRWPSEWRWGSLALPPPGADVKGPWEVSRAQHLVTVGQAYWLTGDERYARCFALSISDFTRRNPVRLGPHWACNMDVSLRVVGWLAALGFFQGSPCLGRRWWELFCRSLVAHGRFMLAHLEFGTLDGRVVTSNHYLANVFGLYWLALNFPGLDAGALWRGTAERALEAECQRQVNPDGGPFEASIPYLRLVLEMLLSAWALGNQAGHRLSEAYRQRVAAGFDFLAAVRQEGGRLPQLGDADDGRAHVFTRYGKWPTESADWLLVAAAHVLGQPRWAEGTGPADQMERVFWGDGALPGEAAAPGGQQAPVRLFPASGAGVVRAGPSQLFIANTPIGTDGFGNHKHNDQLSVEWSVGRQPLLADPGSYSYTSDPQARNAFRATRAHTTVMVDGQEQHELRPELLFRLFARGSGHLEATDMGVAGSHSAYERLGVTFRRRVSIVEGAVLVVDDFLSGTDGHVVEWSFSLYPGVKAEVGQGRALLRGPDGGGCLWVGDLAIWQEQCWYSPGYGRRLPASRLRAARSDGPERVTWALAPLDVEVDLASAARAADELWARS